MDNVTVQTIIEGGIIIILIYIGGVLSRIFKVLQSDKAELDRIRKEVEEIRKDTDLLADTVGGGGTTGKDPKFMKVGIIPPIE
ncbi:MAG TPA: hypothetical protein PLA68_02635 [Panacibacter sp.]|nr:hypothetical protein [Panacibacter sp.]